MSAAAVVLVVDPDRHHAHVLARMLGGRRQEVLTVEDAQAALTALDERPVHVILAEWDLEQAAGGLGLLDQVRRRFPSISVVLMTGRPSIEACKQALRHGAEDYLVKPIEQGALEGLVARLLRRLRRDESDFTFRGVVSRSPAMQRVFRILRRVAPTDITVLIQGESGTGKELTALAIHENSLRHAGPFKPLNCAGLTET
ncbi:MAG TPA: sigma-54-dependent Fis family transcriptional regulator, partial [Phycisphaerales bacterium]|nr:sigma-54-dependent Fis family transcriptional regulator [Phycisphaerales bacterium]